MMPRKALVDLYNLNLYANCYKPSSLIRLAAVFVVSAVRPMPGFVKIATIHDIPTNEVRAFEHDGRQIAIYNVGGLLYATDDICSHAYAELHEGYLDTDDCTIECPLHGTRFDIRNGAV